MEAPPCRPRGAAVSRPGPSGEEGLADVRIIEALYRSAKTRKPEPVTITPPQSRPTKEQVIERPPVPEQELVHAAPSKDD